jgi:hypothetical protein
MKLRRKQDGQLGPNDLGLFESNAVPIPSRNVENRIYLTFGADKRIALLERESDTKFDYKDSGGDSLSSGRAD